MSAENSSDLNIDVEKISQLLKIRPHIYVKLVASFADSLNEKLRLFNDALAAQNREQMRMILHEIKGTAGNLRLNNIVGPETLLHNAIKAGENQTILLKHFGVLKSEVITLQQCIAQLASKEY